MFPPFLPFLIGLVTAPLVMKALKPLLRGTVKTTIAIGLQAKKLAAEAAGDLQDLAAEASAEMAVADTVTRSGASVTEQEVEQEVSVTQPKVSVTQPKVSVTEPTRIPATEHPKAPSAEPKIPATEPKVTVIEQPEVTVTEQPKVTVTEQPKAPGTGPKVRGTEPKVRGTEQPKAPGTEPKKGSGGG